MIPINRMVAVCRDIGQLAKKQPIAFPSQNQNLQFKRGTYLEKYPVVLPASATQVMSPTGAPNKWADAKSRSPSPLKDGTLRTRYLLDSFRWELQKLPCGDQSLEISCTHWLAKQEPLHFLAG